MVIGRGVLHPFAVGLHGNLIETKVGKMDVTFRWDESLSQLRVGDWPRRRGNDPQQNMTCA
jgi:hypothetical protein